MMPDKPKNKCGNCEQKDAEFILCLHRLDYTLIDQVALCRKCAEMASWAVSRDGKALECA
jgi:protein-arginine kinase activator protein McsA